MGYQRFDLDRWSESLFDRYAPKHGFDARGDLSVDEWQREFRRDLGSVLGLPIIERGGVPPLDPCHVSTESRDGYRREKWAIETEPGLDVPFYLLVPDDEDPPYPTVLTVHGHRKAGKELYVGEYDDEDERKLITEEEHDIAVQAVRRGYAALAPDMRGLGELENPEDQSAGRGFCETLQMHSQLLGRSLVGDRVWDVTRLLDFAEGQARLGDRIVLTGNSGGGTVTLFAAAVDTRIDVAIPASYFCAFENSIIALNHCVCNYVPGVVRLGEIWDIAGLVAPRPFLVIAGKEDPIFPIEGVHRAFERLRPIYRAAGAEDRCELWVGSGGHRYYKSRAWSFAKEHL